MIFSVCDHYENSDQNNDENKEDNIVDKKECFICFEDESMTLQIIDLREQAFYIRTCLCKGSIHNICLKKWIDIHKSCPVCRKIVIEMDQTIFIIHRYSPFCINIYLGVKKISIKLISFVMFIILLYFTLDYFVTMIIIKSELYKNLSNFPITVNISDANLI